MHDTFEELNRALASAACGSLRAGVAAVHGASPFSARSSRSTRHDRRVPAAGDGGCRRSVGRPRPLDRSIRRCNRRVCRRPRRTLVCALSSAAIRANPRSMPRSGGGVPGAAESTTRGRTARSCSKRATPTRRLHHVSRAGPGVAEGPPFEPAFLLAQAPRARRKPWSFVTRGCRPVQLSHLSFWQSRVRPD